MRWREWVVGWAAAVVLAGGIAYAVTADREPVVETTVREVVVLPEGQAEVTGTILRLRATGAIGPGVDLPIVVPTGTAVIHGAILGGGTRETIVWDGGRPLRLDGTGGLDLGPATIELEGGEARWPLDDGVRTLLPGDYVLATPVAVGTSGLAEPREGVAFSADGETTIETVGWTLARRLPALRIEGPGALELVGDLGVRTRDGERRARRVALIDGPYVVDVSGDAVTATVRGEMDVE